MEIQFLSVFWFVILLLIELWSCAALQYRSSWLLTIPWVGSAVLYLPSWSWCKFIYNAIFLLPGESFHIALGILFSAIITGLSRLKMILFHVWGYLSGDIWQLKSTSYVFKVLVLDVSRPWYFDSRVLYRGGHNYKNSVCSGVGMATF